MTLYDITPTVSPRLGVWPGDTPPSREVLLDLAKGDTVTLSTLTPRSTSAPTPMRRVTTGLLLRPSSTRSLDYYLGPCQVMRVSVARGARVGGADLTGPILTPRLLLATGTSPIPSSGTPTSPRSLLNSLMTLAGQGVRLVGIDTPSVDLMESKDLPAHQAFLRHDLAILEGLVLRDVPDGIYELIALPLRLEGFDASPVRAVLRSQSPPPP